jgi:lysophospholipase L1-like esterase
MKNTKWLFGLILILLFLGQLSQAQESKSLNPVDSIQLRKAAEKKAQEEWWKNDWPNLGRFRADNAKLGLPVANEKRVVFMGNSITEGWIRIRPAYFSGRSYINRGISGQTTPQMLLRFRSDVIDLKPKVVVILAGTNDIAGNTGQSTLEMIEGNFMSMVELAKANKIKVILCSVLPASSYSWRPEVHPAEKIAQLNVWIKEFAVKNGITYVDFYSPLVNEQKGMKAEYSPDGVHPNEAGYKVMEPLTEKAIAKAMAEK